MFPIPCHVALANDTIEISRTSNHCTGAIPVITLIFPNINENSQGFSSVSSARAESWGPLLRRMFALMMLGVPVECLSYVLKDGFLMEDDLLRLRLQFLINNLVFMNPNTPKIANKLAEKTQP